MNMKILARNRLKDGTIWFEAHETKSTYVLDWKRAAKATLSKSGKILRVRKKPAAEPISLRIVQNMIRAYVRSLRGEESLHATVLEKNGNAIALCGESGAGKSTTAAELVLCGREWNLMTDDVAYLKVKNKRVYVQGNPRPVLKLGENTRRHFEKQNALKRTSLYDPHMEKYIMPASSAGKTRRACNPLTGIYILQRTTGQKNVSAEKLHGAKAALYLLANIYNEVLRPESVLKKQFTLCAQWAKRVPVYQLAVPHGMKHLNAVSSFFCSRAARPRGQRQAR